MPCTAPQTRPDGPGGVQTDTFGKTTVAGLWAVGEVASTGVHGANRLASNSLLEGLVYGARAAVSVATALLPAPSTPAPASTGALVADPEPIRRVRRLMWEHVGLERDETGLATALDNVSAVERDLGPASGEAANMALVARLVASAARDRRESRGAHYRVDYPELDDARRLVYAESRLAGVA